MLEALLDFVWPASRTSTLAADTPVHKVLFVHPNFRIGNIVLATALLPVVRARFPGARLDYLAGDVAASLLDGQPIDRVYCISRRFLLAPWGFVALFLRLRREHYDVAVDGGIGSYSGALYALFSGARQRIGYDGRGSRFLTVCLGPPPRIANAYETAGELARALGVTCQTRPTYHVRPEEDATAKTMLGEWGMVRDGAVPPFLAAFVGGHLGKRWPQARWTELLSRLNEDGVAVVVFIGPEETQYGRSLSATRPQLRVIPPQPLRLFAALLSHAMLLVTPDSGPMHLAAAVGVPSVALLLQERSRFYAPQGAEDRALFRPECEEVMTALHHHPRWPLLKPRDAVRPDSKDSPQTNG
jgi:heptosyltransferase-3